MYFRTLRRQSAEISLSEPIDSDSEGNSLELIDVLSFEEDVLDDLVKADRTEILRRCVYSVLDPREHEIITLRYGLNGEAPLPQREVAQRTGISRSYVSRIEKRALEKLRKHME